MAFAARMQSVRKVRTVADRDSRVLPKVVLQQPRQNAAGGYRRQQQRQQQPWQARDGSHMQARHSGSKAMCCGNHRTIAYGWRASCEQRLQNRMQHQQLLRNR